MDLARRGTGRLHADLDTPRHPSIELLHGVLSLISAREVDEEISMVVGTSIAKCWGLWNNDFANSFTGFSISPLPNIFIWRAC